MVLLGASGHAKELIDIIEDNFKDLKNIYLFDDINSTSLGINMGYDVIKSLDELSKLNLPSKNLVIGTGGPMIRNILYEKTKYLNYNYLNIISKSAIISSGVKLGWGLNIMHQVYIGNSVVIGNGTLLNRNSGIHHDCKIGRFCEVGPSANVLGNVHIGDYVLVGASSTILPNIKVCSDVKLGAGCVVTKNIEVPGTYIGIPARILR